MKNKNRRNFLIKSLAGFTLAIIPKKVFSSSEPEIIVIGAGAAGLAATEHLIKNGKSVLCIEASNRIGGRAITDNKIFSEPYDLGALWIENGETNPFKIYGVNQGSFNLYKERSEEMYAVYNGTKKTSQEDELWKIYDGIEASIAKNKKKDIAPIDIVPFQDERWFNTAHMLVGPWEMGKDFYNYSCKDFGYDYGVQESGVWHCSEGFGTLVNSMYQNVPVQLNTKVKEIDWSGPGVKIETNKGTLKSQKCIITVSTGVLGSGQIKFTPNLSEDKQESFSKISMGHYNRIAFKFKKLFKKSSKDFYLYYKVNDKSNNSPKGMGITIKPSDSNLCICDPGGNFALELAKEGNEASIDFALNELKKIFGNKIQKDLIQSHVADWSTNENFLGAWASAEPGAFEYREILKQSVGDRLYFAGEATAADWGTVAGAAQSGINTAQKLI